jgi:hypothetical protein
MGRRREAAHLLEEVRAGHPGHPLVREKETDRAPSQNLESLLRISRSDELIRLVPETAADRV